MEHHKIQGEKLPSIWCQKSKTESIYNMLRQSIDLDL